MRAFYTYEECPQCGTFFEDLHAHGRCEFCASQTLWQDVSSFVRAALPELLGLSAIGLIWWAAWAAWASLTIILP